MLLKTTALSVLSIVLAAQFGPLQRLLDTVDLNAEQWALCILVSLVDRRHRRDQEGARPGRP